MAAFPLRDFVRGEAYGDAVDREVSLGFGADAPDCNGTNRVLKIARMSRGGHSSSGQFINLWPCSSWLIPGSGTMHRSTEPQTHREP